MSNERLDKLGLYFTHFAVRERYGITFLQFIEMVDSGRWADAMATDSVYTRGAGTESYYQSLEKVVVK